MPSATSTTPALSATTTTFTIERRLAAPPSRVFRAFADVEAKARWFGGCLDGWTQQIRELDFRVGGTERVRGLWKNGESTDFRATYHDIVPNERIVYVYDMYHREIKLSVSLATILVVPDGTGTRLIVTEQGSYFGEDGTASREEGTNFLMDALVKSVESEG